MLLLCCNLVSLAEGGSTTLAAGGFHLPHCCHCRPCESRACRRQLDRSNWIEGTPRRSESETIAEAHGNGDPFSFSLGFLGSHVYPHNDLPTSAAANTVALHRPACCAFGVGVFFFSPHPPLPRASSGATSTEAPVSQQNPLSPAPPFLRDEGFFDTASNGSHLDASMPK